MIKGATHLSPPFPGHLILLPTCPAAHLSITFLHPAEANAAFLPPTSRPIKVTFHGQTVKEVFTEEARESGVEAQVVFLWWLPAALANPGGTSAHLASLLYPVTCRNSQLRTTAANVPERVIKTAPPLPPLVKHFLAASTIHQHAVQPPQ